MSYGRYFKRGTGSPEGVLVAPIGTLYEDTTGGVPYYKGSGAGNTGWVQVGSGSGGGFPPWNIPVAGANLSYALAPALSSLASAGTIPSGAVVMDVPTLDYAAAATNVASWEFGPLSADYPSPGNIDVSFLWMPSTGGAGDVLWRAALSSYAAGDDVIALGIVDWIDALSAAPGSTNQVVSASLSIPDADAGNPAIGDNLILQLYRIGGDVTDTYAGLARLLSVRVDF